jgi:hypothetical protein
MLFSPFRAGLCARPQLLAALSRQRGSVVVMLVRRGELAFIPRTSFEDWSFIFFS